MQADKFYSVYNNIINKYEQVANNTILDNSTFKKTSIQNDLNDYISKNVIVKNSTSLATNIPYTASMIGEFILNPSSVSIIEFQKMINTDPVIFNCLTLLSTSVLNKLGEYNHPNAEIEALVNYSLNNLQIGRHKFFNFMISTALYAGSSVGVFSDIKLYEMPGISGIKRFKNIINNISLLPPTSVAYRIDQQGMLHRDGGIMQYYYLFNVNGWEQGFAGGGVNLQPVGDYPMPMRTPFISPVYLQPFNLKDCIHFSLGGLDSNNSPFGKSILRPVYDYFKSKLSTLSAYDLALAYKNTPMCAIYVDPSMTVLDGHQTKPLIQDIAENIETYRGSGFLLIPGIKDETVSIQTIDNTLDIDNIRSSLETIDNMIISGLLSVNSSGNFSNLSILLDLRNEYINSLAADLEDCILKTFVKRTIDMNYKNITDLGRFRKNENTLDEMMKIKSLFEFGFQNNIVSNGRLDDINLIKDKIPIFGDKITEGKDIPAKHHISTDVPKRNTNHEDMYREINKPYANGLDEYAKRYK